MCKILGSKCSPDFFNKLNSRKKRKRIELIFLSVGYNINDFNENMGPKTYSCCIEKELIEFITN